MRLRGSFRGAECEIETWIDHDQVLRVLDPHGVIIDEDLNGLGSQGLLSIHAEVVEPNLPILADLAGPLAKPEDPAQADGVESTPAGLPQDHLG
jgi:hypothetical protein